MELLDFDETYKPPYRPPAPERDVVHDNAEELNNFGHKKVTEDFEDSPFADRKPVKENL